MQEYTHDEYALLCPLLPTKAGSLRVFELNAPLMRVILPSFFLLFSCLAFGQDWQSRVNLRVRIGDTSQLHQLILLDYTKLLGVVTYVNGDSVRMQVRSVPEPVAIPTRELRFIGLFNPRAEPSGADGEATVVPFQDMTYERTALPYRSSRRLKIISLLYYAYEWNLDRHFQLGIGLAGPLGILATQRYRTSLKSWLHIGLSNQILWVPVADAFQEGAVFVGDATLMLTIGEDQNFFNLGAGQAYNTGEGTAIPIYRLGAGGALSRRWHAYGELVAFIDDFDNLNLLPSVNVSYANRRHRWNFGLLTNLLDEDEWFVPPYPGSATPFITDGGNNR